MYAGISGNVQGARNIKMPAMKEESIIAKLNSGMFIF